MKILSRSDLCHVVSWSPTGKAFRIYDKEKLMQVLTPQYLLEVTKYENFRRKLYHWGSRVVHVGPDCGAWHHEVSIQ